MPRTRNIRGPSVFHAYPLAWPTNRFACGQAQGLSHPLAQGSNAVPRSRPDRLALCHLSRSEIQPVEIQVLLQGLRQLSGTRTRHTSHVTRMHTYAHVCTRTCSTCQFICPASHSFWSSSVWIAQTPMICKPVHKARGETARHVYNDNIRRRTPACSNTHKPTDADLGGTCPPPLPIAAPGLRHHEGGDAVPELHGARIDIESRRVQVEF